MEVLAGLKVECRFTGLRARSRTCAPGGSLVPALAESLHCNPGNAFLGEVCWQGPCLGPWEHRASRKPVRVRSGVAATIEAGTQAAEESANVELKQAAAGPLTFRRRGKRRGKAKPVAPQEIEEDTESRAPVRQLLESRTGPADSESKEEGQKGGEGTKKKRSLKAVLGAFQRRGRRQYAEEEEELQEEEEEGGVEESEEEDLAEGGDVADDVSEAAGKRKRRARALTPKEWVLRQKYLAEKLGKLSRLGSGTLDSIFLLRAGKESKLLFYVESARRILHIVV
jgi:hypothetical protein